MLRRPDLITPVLTAFVLASIPTSALGDRLAVARLDSADLLTAARQVSKGGTLRIEGIRLRTEKSEASFELERFEVFTRDARIEVQGDASLERVPAPKNAYFRGWIAGEPRSSVFLTVLESGEMRGMAASGGKYWVMAAEASELYTPVGLAIRRIDAETEFAAEISGFSCGYGDLHGLDHQRLDRDEGAFEHGRRILEDSRRMLDTDLLDMVLEAQPVASKAAASHTARIAVETDFEFLQRFGLNTQAAIDYVGDLFAYMSGLYAAEVDTTLLVSHLSLWSTSNDPWTQTSPTCGMYEFGRYWNDNRGNVERTTAHFLSGKSIGGGVAWLGVLCSGSFNVNIGSNCPDLVPAIDNYGGAYGFTGGISGSFNINNPGPVWDVVAVSHELGHNFNSDHTHCYGGIGGNAAPVDQCYGGECGSGGCYCGTSSLPCGQTGAGCGTIMSYCHLLSGGMGNISLTFGADHPHGVAPERVPNRMRDHVVSRAGFYPSCLAYEASDGVFSDGFESGDMAGWSTMVN